MNISKHNQQRLAAMLEEDYPAWAIAERLSIKLSVARKLRTEYLERKQEMGEVV